MDWTVLVKVVPSLEQLRYDAERKTMIREGAELFANPFDQRALRVALDLRRMGESVSVLSMGPPAAEASLREALNLGADRALLVTDPALAGSDTLVTSKVLERALAQLGHDVVLAGRWTTDSETGQVGPEIAGLLGVPVISSARAISRDPSGSGLEVTADTEEGWVQYRVEPPVVLTVGEKITKIRKPTSEETLAGQGRRVQTLRALELGFTSDTIGLQGSPTVVGTLTNEEPLREALVFADGTIEDRVRGAVKAVQQLLGPTVPPTAPLFAHPSTPLDVGNEVVVLVTNSDGRLDPRTEPFLPEVLRSLPGFWPSAVWVGIEPSAEDRRTLGRAGALAGYEFRVTESVVSSRTAALAVSHLFSLRKNAAAGIFLSDSFGREVAGQVAATGGLGLTGDAIGFSEAEEGRIVWGKPAFGGGIVAGIHSRTRPSLATLRPGLFGPGPLEGESPEIDWREVGFSAPPSPVIRLGSGKEVDGSFGELDSARVVVSVGMGLGSPDRLRLIHPVLEKWNAALVATRRVIDSGWLPRQLQVGLTGRSLAPELAVLVGVNGGANHMVGWRRARVLLAVNSNPAAPVFRGTNVGIVGDWAEVLALLTEIVPRWT